MQNEKGFTLVEMLVTISILLLIMAIFPFLKPSRQLVFTCETEKLHSFLLQAQMKAMFTKKNMYIQFQTDGVQAGEEFFIYDNMYCEGTAFHYTKQGTISQAQTITCSLQNKKKTIVLQLGSGAIDVR
ncbi:prepilin-type N-terminal cleavage/methylation domain-containing protein [Longicatena caecimuris]|uniref:prepilin-type N-terminal cleavage/methylation domain-containing protein n=1 Tax=Longicatena caecimuris TaxID=1796635 RepID=UPI0022E48B3F|nr:prepilin-type N-terminal cleavage/methylation domain-containing protein [Longicatena caecimuris]